MNNASVSEEEGMKVVKKLVAWVWLKLPLVRILAVEAYTQMRMMKTEEEKRSVWAVIGHGWVDPKILANSILKQVVSSVGFRLLCCIQFGISKENQAKYLNRDGVLCDSTANQGDAIVCHGKGSFFFLTSMSCIGIELSGDKEEVWKST